MPSRGDTISFTLLEALWFPGGGWAWWGVGCQIGGPCSVPVTKGTRTAFSVLVKSWGEEMAADLCVTSWEKSQFIFEGGVAVPLK